MEAHAPVLPEAQGPFKLLLFIDKRPNSTEQVRRIRSHLKALPGSEQVSLDIIDVTNQPYLTEHFKLVAALAAIHRTTEKVQVSIRDTGPGIPRDTQQLIFKENFRLQHDRTEDGYGLGLTLRQRIVRAHYGQLWVDSKQGEGSYFHFTLPVYRG